MAVKTNRYDDIDKRIENLLKSQEELRNAQKKTDEQLKKTDEQLKKTDAQIEKMGMKIDNTAKMVGDSTDGWGKFVVGPTLPSITSCLKDIGFSLPVVETSIIRNQNGENYEIDILCPTRENGDLLAIIIEAKSYINQKKIEGFTKKIRRFREFFPEFKDAKLMAGIAGVRLTPDVKPLAEKQGIYLFSVSKGIMTKINTENFKPRIW